MTFQDYDRPNVWCQLAIRYTKTEVSIFLNGDKTGTRSIFGTYQHNSFPQMILFVTPLMNCYRCSFVKWTADYLTAIANSYIYEKEHVG